MSRLARHPCASAQAPARRGHPGPRRRRRGQALIETSLSLTVVIFAFLALVDTGWLLYNYLTVTQATKRVARYAGMNLHSRSDIQQEFFDGVRATLVSTSNTRIDITTQAVDSIFASLESTNGLPSVQIQVAYSHSLMGPWPGMTSVDLRSSARAMVSTWTESPAITF